MCNKESKDINSQYFSTGACCMTCFFSKDHNLEEMDSFYTQCEISKGEVFCLLVCNKWKPLGPEDRDKIYRKYILESEGNMK